MARQKSKSVTDSLQLHAEIAKLDRMGFSQIEIGKRLTTKISQPRICQILKEQREEYKRTIRRDTEAGIEEKCQQLRDISAEAFAAWERSKLDATETTEEKALRQQFREINGRKVPKGMRMQVVKLMNKTMGRLPANQYLATIQACIEMECKLRGWTDDRPVNINQMTLPWDSLYAPPTVADPLEQALKSLEDKSDERLDTGPQQDAVGIVAPDKDDSMGGIAGNDNDTEQLHEGTNGTTNGKHSTDA